jgi:hypothetical protein
MRTLPLLCLAVFIPCGLHAEEACMTIHGRAHYYGGDGQLRIWHIGTRHEYQPDESSFPVVLSWLNAGVKPADRPKYASPASTVYLFADFEICPSEPFQPGSAQKARVKSASDRHYVSTESYHQGR